MKRWTYPLIGAILILACRAPGRSEEQLLAGIQYVDASTGTITGFAVDYLNPTKTDLTVNVCFDSPTENCVSITANLTSPNPSYCQQTLCHNFSLVVPDGPVGSVTPKDGAPHLIYATLQSPSGSESGNSLAMGSPFPFTWAGVAAAPLYPAPQLSGPSKLTPGQVAVLVNSQDSYSIGSAADVCPDNSMPLGSDGIAGYYVLARGIPCSNVFTVSVPVTQDIPDTMFQSNVAQTLRSIPPEIQAIAIAWVMPSRVFPRVAGQNYSQSITSVVASQKMFEVNTVRAAGAVCLVDSKTNSNPYFNSASTAPFTDFGIRPAMMLAAQSCVRCDPSKPDWIPNVDKAKSLIDRAVAADSTMPSGSVYVMRTSDMSRNLRSWTFSPLDAEAGALSPYASASVVRSDILEDRNDILYYVHGVANPKTSKNTWVPGGIGDSLTSTGGVLPASGNQTPITWWIEQGAVGSYGTVSEPCDAVNKFPDPSVFTRHYTSGASLVEAYWKSVRMPFQGNFIGDPLVAPYFPAATATTAATDQKQRRSRRWSKR